MNETEPMETEPEANAPVYRCPYCDSVVEPTVSHCLMCGRKLAAGQLVVDEAGAQQIAAAVEPEEVEPADAEPVNLEPDGLVVEDLAQPPAAESVADDQPLGEASALSGETAVSPPPTPKPNRQTIIFWGLTAVCALITLTLSTFVLRYPAPQQAWVFIATDTPIPPTATATPVWTPLPSETPFPSPTPTITLTPRPTDTPQPPRFHAIAAGETLIGLSVRYRVSAESIAASNSMGLDSPIQVGQNLEIPWPTPTPDLPYIPIEINGEVVLAVAQNCELYQVQADDTAFGIAARHDIPLEALLAVNWHTPESIALLQPGDVLCIPSVEYDLRLLPPTPGPSPTPQPTAAAAGPELLYPVAGTLVEDVETAVLLQWVAVKDLAPDEWYMVELTDDNDLDALPFRGFTRDNSFRLPGSWRPTTPELRPMRWRVTIVRVTGERIDGRFIYTFGGNASDPAYFTWLGAIPTATPTATSTPTMTPTPAQP